MKMNLSVVMQTIDKMTGPLKKITAGQSAYAEQLDHVKKQSTNLSNNQALIHHFRNTGKEAGNAQQKLNAAQQKMGLLNQKISAAKKPSAALQQQFQKQQQVVKQLQATQNEYTKALTKSQNKMKTAGIDVKRLGDEEKRLSKEYDNRIKQMDKLAKKEQRMQAVRSKLSKFKLPNVGGAAIAKGAGIVSGLSFAGLFATINSSATAMDKLSKSAQNLKMPIETLQAMQSQAEHAGVSSDELTDSMSEFTLRLGELQATGSGTLGSMLKETSNPLFKSLNEAKDNQAAYMLILDEMAKMKTQQEKTFFADAAFGSAGVKMLLMLEEGTTGLVNARKELNALGGGIKAEDAKKAEAYNDALQKVNEAFRSIKSAALAPIMEKLTEVFTQFSDKFKNAQWRTEVIEKVKVVVTNLYEAFKQLGKGFIWASQHLPEIIAGISLLKIAMFALNAVLLANPIGLVIAAFAGVAVGIVYLMQKTGILMPVLGALWEVFKRLGAGISSVFSSIVWGIMWLPRKIIEAMSLIPESFLPDGWGASIKSAQAKLEAFNTDVTKFGGKSINYAVNGEFKETHSKVESLKNEMKGSRTEQPGQKTSLPYYAGGGQAMLSNQSSGYGGILRHPTIQSRSQVEVRIKSDKPIEIAQVQSDKSTDLSVDTGDLVGGF